jgi:hypothetical protein
MAMQSMAEHGRASELSHRLMLSQQRSIMNDVQLFFLQPPLVLDRVCRQAEKFPLISLLQDNV